ncbi:MAG TPA: hypothetical protein VI864_02555 [Candidatus Bathyarchaeia archaeon]|nr:hypothetical protein [Candidatus Bathyarchaeia archaeon]
MPKKECVDIQIRNVPVKLLEEFDRTIVASSYPAGRSEAIRDLMRREIDKTKKP